MIKTQHQQEAAALALELYQLDERRKSIKKRLREIPLIIATADAAEKQAGAEQKKPEDNK